MVLVLQDKRALVTGGSRGIGAGIIKRLARDGAPVTLTYVSKQEQANETGKAAEVRGVRALAVQADSANAESVARAVAPVRRNACASRLAMVRSQSAAHTDCSPFILSHLRKPSWASS